MRTSIYLDEELETNVRSISLSLKEPPATVIRMALRSGLPILQEKFEPPKPEGYFDAAYDNMPDERIEFENAMGKQNQRPER